MASVGQLGNVVGVELPARPAARRASIPGARQAFGPCRSPFWGAVELVGHFRRRLAGPGIRRAEARLQHRQASHETPLSARRRDALQGGGEPGSYHVARCARFRTECACYPLRGRGLTPECGRPDAGRWKKRPARCRISAGRESLSRALVRLSGGDNREGLERMRGSVIRRNDKPALRRVWRLVWPYIRLGAEYAGFRQCRQAPVASDAYSYQPASLGYSEANGIHTFITSP